MQLLDSGTQRGVDISRIERLLGDLWRTTEEERRRGEAVARVRVQNLVAYVEDAGALERVERLADALPSRHPCRLVIVHAVPHVPGDELEAAISARCAIGAGERRQVCCEVITLTAPGDTRRYASSAVASLLVSGLPVSVWWTSRVQPHDEVFQELAEPADQVIVDSREGRDDAGAVIALARWAATENRHAVLGDLAWARILPWRQMVAEFFDPPAARALLPELCEVELTSAGELLSADALLLMGWLASRLGWRWLDAGRDGPAVRAVYRSAGKLVDVYLRRAGDEASPGRLTEVRLSAGPQEARHRFRVRRDREAGVIHTHVEAPGRPELERAAGLMERPDEALIGDLLDARGHDMVYEAALAQAAALAGAAAS